MSDEEHLCRSSDSGDVSRPEQDQVMEAYAILVEAAEHAVTLDVDMAITLLAEAADACFYAGDARRMVAAARRASALLPDHASTRASSSCRSSRQAWRTCSVTTASEASRRSDVLSPSPKAVTSCARIQSCCRGSSWAHSGCEKPRPGVCSSTRRWRWRGATAALGVLPWLLNRVARDHAATESWSTAEVEWDEAMRLAHESGQRIEVAAALAGLARLEARSGP